MRQDTCLDVLHANASLILPPRLSPSHPTNAAAGAKPAPKESTDAVHWFDLEHAFYQLWHDTGRVRIVV